MLQSKSALTSYFTNQLRYKGPCNMHVTKQSRYKVLVTLYLALFEVSASYICSVCKEKAMLV